MFGSKCNQCGVKNCQAERHCSMCGRTENLRLAINLDYPLSPTLNLPTPQKNCWPCMTSFTSDAYGFMCQECDQARRREHECHHVIIKIEEALQQMRTLVNSHNARLYPMAQSLLSFNHSLEEVNVEMGMCLDASLLDVGLEILTFTNGEESWRGYDYAMAEDIGDFLLDLPSNRYYYERYVLPARLQMAKPGSRKYKELSDEKRDFTHFNEAEVQFYGFQEYHDSNRNDKYFIDKVSNYDRPVIIVRWPTVDYDGMATLSINPVYDWDGWLSPLMTFRGEDEGESRKSDFEQEFDRVETVVSDLFKEFSWWSDNREELYDVSDLHKDAAGYARLRELESHLAMLTRPGSLLWSSGDDSAYDAYPDDLQNPYYLFEKSGIYVDGEDDWETDGYTDEERGEPGEEIYGIQDRPKSPDYDIRLRYAYTLNCLSQLAEQYFSRLDELRSVLKPQFESGRVTIYRALALTEDERPMRRKQTIFPLSMKVSGNYTRYWENPELREKYTYNSYGPHWSLIPGFEWSNDFPSYSGGRAVTIEKQIPYTEVDWFHTLLIMAYGREPEFEVAVNENVFLAENEVKIPLYHVTPLTQVASILTTGLEPRIGPRSELMELEPRVYLFGERESMQDSFIWEEMTDDRYGDEWLSGYAVLRIDLPAEWFTERRVVKTFDPDGPEPSWEWSTDELIPPEYIEVEEEWEWAEDDISRYFRAEQDISYPLRLYHGTSVRNWRAIQASGELRTGCLASSHGYDIDMPDTYIDLAIGEIEDGHPDIKAGGVVLEITFPDQATADQYLQADTTMYDLGMAVLEDDLYSRYAPADWQPAEVREGWHYGSWDWWQTDFQDLVKSNQATKTIPYYPQDLSDWQASYLSVYSVCIKQPIPLEYITVTWGSESRRAETEPVETVGEAWSKALEEWNRLTEWSEKGKQLMMAGEITEAEFQKAIEVYHTLNAVALKITEPNFIGGSLDEILIEEYINDFDEDFDMKDYVKEFTDFKTNGTSYFFYYAILRWIQMMNFRLTSTTYGSKQLNDVITSQFNDSSLKGYRWVSVADDAVPGRTLSRNKYQFTYGSHWSLHPEIYTWTYEWDGVRHQKDYLIEKDVPVEDIDWFATLISCLFFLEKPEFEIIMKPTTYIAETVDEPHLYLDMDGCFADFAGAITRRVNEVLQVQDVSEISSKSLRRAVRKAHRMGIDSVTREDFDLSLVHEPERKRVIDRMLYKIASEPGFFYSLDVMNRDLLDEIVASGRPFSFLTAPIGGSVDYSVDDKRDWVRDRLGLDVEVIVVPREQKVDYCQPGDILLDDHAGTIAEWREAGGVGIWFPHERI